MLLADVTSWMDPQFWFDRLGFLGVLIFCGMLMVRFFGPKILAVLDAQVDLINHLKGQSTKFGDSLESIEEKQERFNQKQDRACDQITEIHTLVRAKGV